MSKHNQPRAWTPERIAAYTRERADSIADARRLAKALGRTHYVYWDNARSRFVVTARGIPFDATSACTVES